MVRDSGARWSEGIVQHVVFKFSSDRPPIVLSLEVISHGLRSFHFFNVWSDNPDLRLVVKEEWDESGVLSSSFWRRMKAIKEVVCH